MKNALRTVQKEEESNFRLKKKRKKTNEKRKLPGKMVKDNCFSWKKYTEKGGMRIWMLADCGLCPGDEDCELDAEGDRKSEKGDD